MTRVEAQSPLSAAVSKMLRFWMRRVRDLSLWTAFLGGVACQGRGGSPADSQAAALPAPQQPVAVRIDTLQLPRPTVETGCVPDQPRNSFAEVRWLAPRNLAQDSMTVDFTVFKDGFEANRYAAFDARSGEPRLQMFFRPETELRAMNVRGVAARRAGDTTIVRVERLDAGVNYFWRLRANVGGQWVVGVPVRVQAATCVYDEPQQPVRR